MTEDERKILFIYEYFFNQEVIYKMELDDAIYNICQRKKWNVDNFNAVIKAFFSYRTFQKVSKDVCQILSKNFL